MSEWSEQLRQLHPVAIVAMVAVTLWGCYVVVKTFAEIDELVSGRRRMPRAKNTSQGYLRALRKGNR